MVSVISNMVSIVYTSGNNGNRDKKDGKDGVCKWKHW